MSGRAVSELADTIADFKVTLSTAKNGVTIVPYGGWKIFCIVFFRIGTV